MMEMNNDPYAPPEFRHLFDGRTYFPASVTHITSNPFHVSSNNEGMICESMNNTRWPRQETLTLLEIRSRLDDKFKEVNQKGPLWDEVSRIMVEEHGYHRSGKKCREKFDNLYKYYKKTKEGKARRQDGKHYRFFRQLEALCGGNCQQSSQNKYEGNYSHFQMTNPGSSKINQEVQPQDLCEDLMFLNSSEYDTSSSSDDNGATLNIPGYIDTESIEMNKDTRYPKTGKGVWKSKTREFIDSKMKSVMEIQEAWLEKMLTTLEHKEKEMMIREEEWRKQERERLEREYELRANEKAWIEARDVALMEALQKISNRTVKRLSSQRVTSTDRQDRLDIPREVLDEKLNEHLILNGWSESEISSLIKLICNMELRAKDELHSKDDMWEKISAEMSRMGYNHNAKRCKDTWENIRKYLRNDESNKESAQTGRTSSYFQHHGPIYRRGNDADVKESRSKANLFPISHVGMTPNDNYYHRLLVSQGQNPWENYSKKINQENNCE